MFCLFCISVASVLCLSRVSSCSLLGFSSAFSAFVLVSFLPLLLACFGFLPSFVSVPRLRSPSSSRFLSLFPIQARSLVLCSLSFRASLVLFSSSLTRFASDLLASRFISVSFLSAIRLSVLAFGVRWRRLGITSVFGDGALSPVLLPPVVTSVGAGEGVDGPLPSHKSEK